MDLSASSALLSGIPTKLRNLHCIAQEFSESSDKEPAGPA
jgi:hypothetical protein